jgi:hypothetical protein
MKAAKLSSILLGLLVAGCASGAPASTPTPAPAQVASPSPFAIPSPTGRTHVLSDRADGGVPITVTMPVSGWYGEPGGWALERGAEGFSPPDGAAIIAFVVDEEFYVYGDPCHWRNTRPDAPATTVDELVAALAGQPSRNPSAPEDITVGGYPGKKISLRVPDDAAFRDGAFTDCDDQNFSSFGVAGEDPARWHQGPGQIDEMWILDVNGKIALLDASYYAKTPQDAVDELHAILSSASFD